VQADDLCDNLTSDAATKAGVDDRPGVYAADLRELSEKQVRKALCIAAKRIAVARGDKT
jgi:hypothetical protein